jgi:hypothetical protein
VVVDGYFMKKDFIHPLLEQGLQIITKTRSDANLRYLYKGRQKERGSFSMAEVKMLHMNELITNRIFSILDVDPSSEKFQQAFESCLNFGRLRA